MRYLLALGLLFVLTACGGGASYNASVTRVASANGQQMAVWVRIRNVSSSAGTPSNCSVDLYDTGGSKVGSNHGFALKRPIPAGGSKTVGVYVDVKAALQFHVRPGDAIAVCV